MTENELLRIFKRRLRFPNADLTIDVNISYYHMKRVVE